MRLHQGAKLIIETRTFRISEFKLLNHREMQHNGSHATHPAVSVVNSILENAILVMIFSTSVEGRVTFLGNTLRIDKIIGAIKPNVLQKLH